MNVVPREAPDKGDAVAALLRARAGRGRRSTWATTSPTRTRSGSVDVGVRVGRTARSAAGWYLAAQGAIDDLLRALLAARTRLDGRGDRADGLALAIGD